MAGYRIDEQVVRQVSAALNRGGASVADGGRALGWVPAAGLGTGDLDAAAGDLVAGWTAAFGELGHAVDDIAAGVHRCLAGYTDAERHIADLFRDGP
ncbi:MAG TPA: hypothetical protein VFW65_22025 [Pseudonocardiaceae bacterium]|nr:hypothetical protein [Pseudonocardiaceae bacterium]